MGYPVYPRYKQSRIDWVDQIPEHWQETSIKRYFSIQLGKMLQPQSLEPKDLEVSYLRAANVQWESVDTNDLPKMWATPDEIEKFSVKEGDLLICEGGEVGRTATLGQIENPCIIQNALHRVRSTKNTSTAYLKYLMRHIADTGWFSILCNKTTIAHLTGEKLAEIGLPLAPLSEQQTIARFLDHKTAQIDALIAKKEALLQKLAEKRAALISQAVTQGLDPTVPMKDSGVAWLGQIPAHWGMTRLKYATALIVDCPHDTPRYSPEGDFLVVRTADLSSGVMDLSSAYRVDEDEYLKRIRRAEVKPGDILYGREGERWGFAAEVPEEPKVCLGQRMMQFRASAHFCPHYLMWHLNADCVYQQGVVDTYGSTAPHVNVETIKNYWLVEPPLTEQKAIAKHLDAVTTKFAKQVAAAHRAISTLSEYRAALITAAVTGQIDVRGVSLPDSSQQEAA
ncbi:restriction endonuclease subunit S [Azonexus sp. IMCC34842]|uniref:restriction endonuclease subunit S n=1 Tax=Azonexus sp. IMCC34842 TaxID=3420950 RepID=UPI003D0EDDA8